MTLGQQIATRRKDQRLSVSEAARRAGVHRLTWTAWESGKAAPVEHRYAAIESTLSWARGSVESIQNGGEPKEAAPVVTGRPSVDAGLARVLEADHRELVLMFRVVESERGRSTAEDWLVDALDLRDRARQRKGATKRDVS